MVDYSKWDALELSDDSEVEVHPNVDKRSFIRAKQSQIHVERQQRKLQVEALKYQYVINDALMQRLSALLSALKSQHDVQAEEEAYSRRNPADVAFRAIMDLAPRNPAEDTPPPRPEGVFDAEASPLPTYSKMIAGILDDANKTLDEKRIEQDQRYEALVEELGVHLRNIQDLQTSLVKKLDELERQGSMKITSESYHVGFDRSYVNKVKPGEQSKENTTVELLNPKHNLDNTNSDTSTKTTLDVPKEGDEEVRASPAAKKFAQIKASDYRASYEYISSHPEILQESETDGLLIDAFNAIFEHGDNPHAWQYVHQALLLQWCRMLGRDGVTLFFKRITTPGHQARALFEKEVSEKFQRILEMAKRNANQQGATDGGGNVEQIQIHPVDRNSSINIQIPPAESEDEEVRKARTIFEGFAPEMRAALESGSLDEVNKVLGAMNVTEAENLVSLLGDAGCLSVEKEIIDTTTEEGKRHLRDMEEAVIADAEAVESEKTLPAESDSPAYE